MELLLNKVCGQPAALPVAVCRCGPADAAAFYALQNEVRAAMPHPEQFVPDTRENITAYLAHDLCLGVFDGERLGAYFILRYCGQSEHNYAAFLGIPRPSGTTGPMPTAPSSIRTGGATACSGSCWKPPCRFCSPASWASGPPSARKISTA